MYVQRLWSDGGVRLENHRQALLTERNSKQIQKWLCVQYISTLCRCVVMRILCCRLNGFAAKGMEGVVRQTYVYAMMHMCIGTTQATIVCTFRSMCKGNGIAVLCSVNTDDHIISSSQLCVQYTRVSQNLVDKINQLRHKQKTTKYGNSSFFFLPLFINLTKISKHLELNLCLKKI